MEQKTIDICFVRDKKQNLVKLCRSPDYNYLFNLSTGYFLRWGKTEADDPELAPGPEILDIEITTICANGCPFCYKGNTGTGSNMSFETFKTILDKFPPTLTQLAFGADANATSNPDLWKMADYARSKFVIPNITVANISDDTADRLVKVMGAVAVSRYANKNPCYDSIKKLTDRGMKQVNIHNMICEETFDQTMETIHDMKTDPRLAKMNALVMLSLKRKGRGEYGFTPLAQNRFNLLVQSAVDAGINYGFDSCGSSKFINYLETENPIHRKQLEMSVEPCESGLFSTYINVDGVYAPCSFCEGVEGWEQGIDMKTVENFSKDVWFSPRLAEWRKRLLDNKRGCPIYDI